MRPGAADVVYGRNAVAEALVGRRRVRELLGTERGVAALGPLPGAAPIPRIVPPSVLDDVAGSREHQGVVARADPYPYVDADELLAQDRPLIVALDEITDPQNLGAVARSAECAGAHGLVIPRHRSAVVTAAVCKASAGAVEHLPIAVVPNLADWLERAKRPGLWCWAAAAEATQTHTEVDFSDGCVLVIGAEGKGVRPRVRASCDGLVRIPLRGRIESLNASVAAAVLLYEVVRQRTAAGPGASERLGRTGGEPPQPSTWD